jgi:hypothetical protein
MCAWTDLAQDKDKWCALGKNSTELLCSQEGFYSVKLVSQRVKEEIPCIRTCQATSQRIREVTTRQVTEKFSMPKITGQNTIVIATIVFSSTG